MAQLAPRHTPRTFELVWQVRGGQPLFLPQVALSNARRKRGDND